MDLFYTPRGRCNINFESETIRRSAHTIERTFVMIGIVATFLTAIVTLVAGGIIGLVGAFAGIFI